MSTQEADYKSTLNLPKTAFAMKAELPKREPECLARWEAQDLYGQIRKARAGKERFVLHDGPPYANGDIHIGHALNKILKDVIVRYKTMRGFDAPYIPGWDCHGMPIEHALFKELKITKHQIAQTDFRQKARAYAEKYVGIQREQFKRLAVMGDWAQPYLTMAKDYELTILRVFRELVQAGYIYRGKKPVYWCATDETALAEAEVEYEDRKDTSIYVTFPVISPPQGHEKLFSQAVAVVAWTTTPWTLPANVALCFHPDANYTLLEGSPHLLVASDLAERFATLLHTAHVRRLGEVTGKELQGMRCRGPFGGESVAVTDDGVSMAEGTGVVHIAPGHGTEDYMIGQRQKLPVLSPVDHQGRFTKDVPAYAGQTVFEANPKIVQQLCAGGQLLGEEAITHSYPHCWRCKQPVIFRATPQWFLNVEHEGLRQRLLASAKQVAWIPGAGVNRISGMLESRPDWCLSRQRYWGTPIPVLHCTACEEPVLDAKVIERIERTLSEQGIDAWFTLTPAQLAPGASCPKCKGTALSKDTDILDVWFDSGVSHEAVLKPRGLGWPASLYLEGSDQHRGWFQVSLIPSVALHNQPPYRKVLTHGFVMDGEGRKMSKSLGNVVAPQEVMQRYGADILRLWVASVDYREDVRISEEILGQVAESYRKIRNTFRYLLANLFDFNPAEHCTRPEDGTEMDRWALERTGELTAAVTKAYETHQFHEVARAVYQFCVLDLSAFYLDALKDRLYTDPAGSVRRRCAQTVLYAILVRLVKTLAPILAVTADEVWQAMREAGWVEEASVHLAPWPAEQGPFLDDAGKTRWAAFLSVREAAMKSLEEARARGVIGSPLEAHVTLLVSRPEFRSVCEASRDALAEALVVSGVSIEAEEAGCATPNARLAAIPGAAKAVAAGLTDLRVERAPGAKCARCWKYLSSVGSESAHPRLCGRCARVVMEQRG